MDDYRKAFYDAYATTHTIPRKGEVTPARLRHLARHWRAHFQPLLPRERTARILDVGCGDGTLLLWIQQCGYRHAAGVGISAEQVSLTVWAPGTSRRRRSMLFSPGSERRGMSLCCATCWNIGSSGNIGMGQ